MDFGQTSFEKVLLAPLMTYINMITGLGRRLLNILILVLRLFRMLLAIVLAFRPTTSFLFRQYWRSTGYCTCSIQQTDIHIQVQTLHVWIYARARNVLALLTSKRDGMESLGSGAQRLLRGTS